MDLGAQGRYADAAAILHALLDVNDRWSSLALSVLASHHRQVGDAAGAVRLDRQALQAALDAECRADALTGLAADAVAEGVVEQALAQHVEAASDAAMHWRTLTRWHWVAAEQALLSAHRPRAVEHARHALVACAGQSARHEAKSLIILAAASGEARDLPTVSPIVREGGWVTLEWPLALVAADHGAQVPPAWLRETWEAGREATYAIERGLPEPLIQVWRAHPGVHRLRAEGPPSGGG